MQSKLKPHPNSQSDNSIINTNKKVIILHRKGSNRQRTSLADVNVGLGVCGVKGDKKDKEMEQSSIMTARFQNINNSLQIVEDDLKSRHLYLLQMEGQGQANLKQQMSHNINLKSLSKTNNIQNGTLATIYSEHSLIKQQTQQKQVIHNHSLINFDNKIMSKNKILNKIGVINLSLITNRRSVNRSYSLNNQSIYKDSLQRKGHYQDKGLVLLSSSSNKLNVNHQYQKGSIIFHHKKNNQYKQHNQYQQHNQYKQHNQHSNPNHHNQHKITNRSPYHQQENQIAKPNINKKYQQRQKMVKKANSMLLLGSTHEVCKVAVGRRQKHLGKTLKIKSQKYARQNKCMLRLSNNENKSKHRIIKFLKTQIIPLE